MQDNLLLSTGGLGIYGQVSSFIKDKLCITNKYLSVGFDLGVSIIGSLASYALLGGPNSSVGSISKVLNTVSQTAFSSALGGGIGIVDEQIITKLVEPGLEALGLEEYEDYVNGAMQIAEGIALGQASKLTVNAGIGELSDSIQSKMMSFSPFKGIKGGVMANPMISPMIKQDNVASIKLDNDNQSWWQKGLNAVAWPFMKVSQGINNVFGTLFSFFDPIGNNNADFFSKSLSTVGFSKVMGGIFTLGGTLFNNLIMGGNKAYGLSVYDIQKLLRTGLQDQEIDKNQLKQISKNYFEQLKYCEQSIAGMEDEAINTVIDLNKKCFSGEMKAQYQTIIQDPKLLEKAYAFIDAQMELTTIQPMLEAENMKAQFQQLFRLHPVTLTSQEHAIAKQLAVSEIQQRIAQYEQKIAISNEEKQAVYKAFYQPTLDKLKYTFATQKITAALSQESNDDAMKAILMHDDVETLDMPV